MVAHLALVFAATPVTFSAVNRDADQIMLVTVVSVDHAAKRTKFEVEQVYRGAAVDRFELDSPAFGVGTRELLFVKARRLMAELVVKDGIFTFLSTRLVFDGPLARFVALDGWPATIPQVHVLEALGQKEPLLPPATAGARVVSISCAPCDFKVEVAKQLRGGFIDCGSVDAGATCFRNASKLGKVAIVRGAWSGIDSEGTRAVIGTTSAAQLLSFDSDVTGGTHPPCCQAVFSNSCTSVDFARPDWGCAARAVVLCSERDSAIEVLGPRVPIEALDAGEIRFHSDAGSMVCYPGAGGSLACR